MSAKLFMEHGAVQKKLYVNNKISKEEGEANEESDNGIIPMCSGVVCELPGRAYGIYQCSIFCNGG